MQGLMTLILILTPMFIGFLLPKHPSLMRLSEKSLNFIVFALLIIIGIELGLVDDLQQQVGNIAKYLISLLILTVGLGSVALIVFDRSSRTQRQLHANTPAPTSKPSMTGSLIQLGCLVIGFLLAKWLPAEFLPPKQTTTALLMVLLLMVGISLKGSGVRLRDAMLNKQGVKISLVFMLTTLLGGVVFAGVFDEVSITKGLALASGFGWYSLSGPIMTDSYGAIWGSVALLNDLIREIIALIFIPVMMRFSSSSAIGLGGVTSLDFTLPTILSAGGTHIMPTVISFGFITNVVSPVLMVFFSSLG